MQALRSLNPFLRCTFSVVFRTTLCSCLLDCTLDNLKEHHVARLFFFFVAGTMRADGFSPTGPSFLKGFMFVLVDLVVSRFAGGRSWDITQFLAFLFFFFFFFFFFSPPVPRSWLRWF